MTDENNWSDDDATEQAQEAAAEASTESSSAGEEQPAEVETRSTTWASKSRQWFTTTVLSPALAIGAGTEAVDSTIGTGWIPGSSRVWGWLLNTAHRGYVNSTGADMLGYEMKRGHLLPKPLIYNPDSGRWETQDGETWWQGREDGVDIYRGPGGVSVAWGSSRANQLGTDVQAQVAEALDMGFGQVLTTGATVNLNKTTATTQQARADGGVDVQATAQITAQNPGQFSDYVIPINKLFVDDGELVDARLVSMEKYYQTYPETTESEEHQRAEDRARIAESDGDQAAYAMKMLLIAGATIVLAIAAFAVLPELLSGSGGGGGGIMPF